MPLLLTEIPRLKQLKLNRISLIIGALISDIIDKSLFLLGLGEGRMLSHNLLFVIVSILIVHIIFKGNKSISFPFMIGLISHIILDLPDVPLFYPFISYDFYYIEEPLIYWLRKLWTDPIVIITEISGIFFIIYIIISNKLYHKNDIFNYLKGLNQLINQSYNEKELSI